jgi:large subunit ribosomal protein L30e
MVDLAKELPLLFKTGKVVYGYKEVINVLYHGKVNGVIIASKIPKEIFDKLTYYCKLANVPYYIFEGSSAELGKLCGKNFVISSIAILNAGESSILDLFKNE